MKSLLSIVLSVVFSLAISTQSHAQAPEQLLPGSWTSPSPQGSTTFHMDIRNPVKNADGSVSFEGEMWTSGAVPTGKGKMEGARLVGDKVTLTHPTGNASLTLQGQKLVGFVTYFNRTFQDLSFSKQ